MNGFQLFIIFVLVIMALFGAMIALGGRHG